MRRKPKSENKRKVRIEIPENQLLTSDELKRLIANIKKGDVL